MSHSKTTSGARGFRAARWGTHKYGWELLGVRRVEGEKGWGGVGGEGGRLSKGAERNL